MSESEQGGLRQAAPVRLAAASARQRVIGVVNARKRQICLHVLPAVLKDYCHPPEAPIVAHRQAQVGNGTIEVTGGQLSSPTWL